MIIGRLAVLASSKKEGEKRGEEKSLALVKRKRGRGKTQSHQVAKPGETLNRYIAR